MITKFGRIVQFVVVLLALFVVGGGTAYAASPTSTGSACHVTSQFMNNGQGPFLRVTETGTCGDNDVVSLALWWATSLDGNPISSQQRVAVILDQALPLGVTDANIPMIADGACFWQLDLAWGHAPSDLSTPYGNKLIYAWHGGNTDCLTRPTTPPPTPPTPSATVTTPAPTPSETVTTPAPVPSATTPAPSPSITTPAPTTTKVSPKPTPTHHKPVHHPKPTPTHHKPVVTPSASGCVASGCDKPTPAPTTTPAVPQLPMTGTTTGLLVGLGIGLIGVGTAFLLVLAHWRRRGLIR